MLIERAAEHARAALWARARVVLSSGVVSQRRSEHAESLQGHSKRIEQVKLGKLCGGYPPNLIGLPIENLAPVISSATSTNQVQYDQPPQSSSKTSATSNSATV